MSSTPEDTKQQQARCIKDDNNKVFEGALIVLLLVIAGLLIRVSFTTYTPAQTTQSTDLSMELARLRLQVAKSEDLMMRLLEQTDTEDKVSMNSKALGEVMKQLKKLNTDVLVRDQEIMKELQAVKMKLKETTTVAEDYASSMEELKGYMSSMLTKIKSMGNWFN